MFEIVRLSPAFLFHRFAVPLPPGGRYFVGGWGEARTFSVRQIAARIPHPSLRDTFPPGEGFVETASFCFGAVVLVGIRTLSDLRFARPLR